MRIVAIQILCLPLLAVLVSCSEGSTPTRPDRLEQELPPALLPPPPPPSTSGGLVSFPGAEGFGAEALNACRLLPGELKVVTNLNDAGAGSLRAALENSDPNKYTIVIFRTGGTFPVDKTIYIRDKCLYIAGQSAPGSGVLIRPTYGYTPISNRASNVAMRYLRVRQTGLADETVGGSNIGIHNSDVILDHVSASWTTDDNIAIWRAVWNGGEPPIQRITIQRTLMGEGLAQHSVGSLFGGTNSKDGHEGVYRISYHHNFFTRNAARNPTGSAGNAQVSTTRGAEIINNLVYEWENNIGRHFKNSVIDWVNNHWRKTGPCPNNVKIRHDPAGAGDPSFYISGNITDGDCVMPANQWEWLRADSRPYGPLPTSWQRSVRLAPAHPVSVQPASQVWNDVLADVGANERLDCSGGWVAAQDAVDSRMIAQARAGTKDPLPVAAGPFPSMDPGTPCADADGDGMPDQWEGLRGLDPSDPADAWTDADGDGYLNLEEYLNGT